MHKIIPTLFLVLLNFTSSCNTDETTNTTSTIETDYEINENSAFQDFLTPNYYNQVNTTLRNDINKLIHFIRLENYQHPFQETDGTLSPHSINREFGTGIGLNGTSQHHPATDLHPDNSANVNLYAAHDGIINTYRNNPKYRHHLTITKEIKDADDNSIGKLVSIYAHIDLDLDESQLLFLDGVSIQKGELISKNLYSGTMGGAHLHFEIICYRNSEIGNEEFYSWENNSTFTNPSLGIWTYGYWNPNFGYGFINPTNLGID